MKDQLINLALVLGSLTCAAFLLEGILRASAYEPQLQYIAYLGREQVKDPLPGVPYLYPAFSSFRQSWPRNPRGYFDAPANTITYQTNNYGFRDDDFSLARNAKLRIAVLGDSFCWGNGVKQEDLFASLLERRLNARTPLHQQYEVYNFCLGGYNTAHEAALYSQVVRYFQPDAVIVSYVLNDVNIPPQLFLSWQLVDGGTWWREWRMRWRLLDVAVAPFNRAANHRITLNRLEKAYQKGQPGYASVAQGLQRLRTRTRAQHVPAILVIFPWFVRLEADSYPFQPFHHIVTSLGHQADFAVLDLLPTFVDSADNALWVYPGDQHPNEIAHNIAAQEIGDFLIAYLEQQGSDILHQAQVRRGTALALPGPPPGREWYLSFAKLLEEESSQTLQSGS